MRGVIVVSALVLAQPAAGSDLPQVSPAPAHLNQTLEGLCHDLAAANELEAYIGTLEAQAWPVLALGSRVSGELVEQMERASENMRLAYSTAWRRHCGEFGK